MPPRKKAAAAKKPPTPLPSPELTSSDEEVPKRIIIKPTPSPRKRPAPSPERDSDVQIIEPTQLTKKVKKADPGSPDFTSQVPVTISSKQTKPSIARKLSFGQLDALLDAPAVPASSSKDLGSPADIGKRSRKPSKKAAEMAKRSKAVISDSESDVDATHPPDSLNPSVGSGEDANVFRTSTPVKRLHMREASANSDDIPLSKYGKAVSGKKVLKQPVLKTGPKSPTKKLNFTYSEEEVDHSDASIQRIKSKKPTSSRKPVASSIALPDDRVPKMSTKKPRIFEKSQLSDDHLGSEDDNEQDGNNEDNDSKEEDNKGDNGDDGEDNSDEDGLATTQTEKTGSDDEYGPVMATDYQEEGLMDLYASLPYLKFSELIPFSSKCGGRMVEYQTIMDNLTKDAARSFRKTFNFVSFNSFINPARAPQKLITISGDRLVSTETRQNAVFLCSGHVAECHLVHGVTAGGFGGASTYLVKKILIHTVLQDYKRTVAYIGNGLGTRFFHGNLVGGALVFQTRKEGASNFSSNPSTPSKGSKFLGSKELTFTRKPVLGNYSNFLSFEAKVPIYDCRKTPFLPTEEAFKSLSSIPLYMDDLPASSTVTVGYTVQTYPFTPTGHNTAEPAVTFYLQFVLLHSIMRENVASSSSARGKKGKNL